MTVVPRYSLAAFNTLLVHLQAFGTQITNRVHRVVVPVVMGMVLVSLRKVHLPVGLVANRVFTRMRHGLEGYMNRNGQRINDEHILELVKHPAAAAKDGHGETLVGIQHAYHPIFMAVFLLRASQNSTRWNGFHQGLEQSRLDGCKIVLVDKMTRFAAAGAQIMTAANLIVVIDLDTERATNAG